MKDFNQFPESLAKIFSLKWWSSGSRRWRSTTRKSSHKTQEDFTNWKKLPWSSTSVMKFSMNKITEQRSLFWNIFQSLIKKIEQPKQRKNFNPIPAEIPSHLWSIRESPPKDSNSRPLLPEDSILGHDATTPINC